MLYNVQSQEKGKRRLYRVDEIRQVFKVIRSVVRHTGYGDKRCDCCGGTYKEGEILSLNGMVQMQVCVQCGHDLTRADFLTHPLFNGWHFAHTLGLKKTMERITKEQRAQR